MPGQNTPLMQPILYFLGLYPVGVPCSMNLLRSQSFSACFLPVDRPIKRSKLVLAVCPAVVPAMRLTVVPAVAHSNKIISKNL